MSVNEEELDALQRFGACLAANNILDAHLFLHKIKDFGSLHAHYDTPSLVNMAIRHDEIFILEMLIEKNIDITKPDRFSDLPLYVAMSIGHLGATKVLLANGANPNTVIVSHYWQGKDRDPILNLAIIRSNQEVVDLLVEYGANPLVCDNYGYDAFWHAKDRGKTIKTPPQQYPFKTRLFWKLKQTYRRLSPYNNF